MKMSIVDPEIKGITLIRTEHNGEECYWNAITWDRTKFINISTFFDDINRYFSSLTDQQQQGVWEIYKKTHNVLSNETTILNLFVKVRNLVKELYNFINLEELKKSVLFYGNIKIPLTMKTDYGPKDIKPRTYLRNDYIDLVIFSIALRPLVPIIGVYIEKIKKEIGNTHKEHNAMGLLAHSSIYNCPAMERLRLYVLSSVEYEDMTPSAILNGLGSEERPEWLLNRCIVRKVLLGEVDVPGDKSTIISNIYNYIISTNRSMDRHFSGRVTDKREQAREGIDEDNVSQVENYKIKQEISDGVKVLLAVYTEDVVKLASDIDNTIDPNLLIECVNNAIQKEDLAICPHHLTFTQWVLSKSISPRGIPSLNKPSLLRSIGVTQALLWHWGFKEFSLLMTAYPFEFTADYVNTIETRARIPKDMLDILVNKYPHFQRTNSKMQNERQSNVGAKAIDLITKELFNQHWVVNGPDFLVKQTMEPGKNIIYAPSDTKSQLVSLLLKITE